MREELQELVDAVREEAKYMVPHPAREPGSGLPADPAWLTAGAASQERVIQALSAARKALEPPVLRWKGGEAHEPTKSHTNDAGWDLYVAEHCRIPVGSFRDVDLGIAVEFPPGWWGRIVGRSSTFRKRGLLCLEGIIDEGYRGGLYIGVTNLSDQVVELHPGERVCQLILQPTPHCRTERVAELTPSERGENGFGSTGR